MGDESCLTCGVVRAGLSQLSEPCTSLQAHPQLPPSARSAPVAGSYLGSPSLLGFLTASYLCPSGCFSWDVCRALRYGRKDAGFKVKQTCVSFYLSLRLRAFTRETQAEGGGGH